LTPRTQIIPVRLGTPTRTSGKGFTFRPPLVPIHIASDETWSTESRSWPEHSAKIYSALVDTGADHCGIDRSVAAEIGAKSVGSGYTHHWIGTDEDVPFVAIQIVIRPGVIFVVEAAVNDSRGRGQQWDAVLGRDFLSNCRLYVDGPSSRYHLEWTETSTPK
jgi:Aspartyl protease